jgi:hypothetical protein
LIATKPGREADIETLHALVAVAERDRALSQIDRLRHLPQQLQRVQLGRRLEKLDPEQLLLALKISSKPLPATRRPKTRRTRRGTNARRQALRCIKKPLR